MRLQIPDTDVLSKLWDDTFLYQKEYGSLILSITYSKNANFHFMGGDGVNDFEVAVLEKDSGKIVSLQKHVSPEGLDKIMEEMESRDEDGMG